MKCNRWNLKKSLSMVLVLACMLMAMLGLTGCEDIFYGGSVADSQQVSSVTNVTEGVTDTSETKSTTVAQTDAPETQTATQEQIEYRFRNKTRLKEHYEKHGIEMGFSSKEEYEKAASAVVNNPKALHKTEKEDGDDVYYVEETNEFVIVSTDGYLRTYFKPNAGIDYYNRQ